MQNVYELDIDIACVTEPASVTSGPRWAARADGSAAIYIKSSRLINKCATFKVSRSFVVVRYDHLYFFSIYIAPSVSDHDFNVILDDLSAVVRTTGGRVYNHRGL